MIGVCGGDDDSETLPGSKFLAGAGRAAPSGDAGRAKSLGIDIVAGRRASMTKRAASRPATTAVGAAPAAIRRRSSARRSLIPFAPRPVKLEIQPQCASWPRHGRQRQGPRQSSSFDRKTGAEHEVLGKVGSSPPAASTRRASCSTRSRPRIRTASATARTSSAATCASRSASTRSAGCRRWPAADLTQRSRHRRQHITLRRFNHKAPHKRDYLRGFGVQFRNTGASDAGAHSGSETISASAPR
jgi:hypothetical protein